jgi:hypothetical protein
VASPFSNDTQKDSLLSMGDCLPMHREKTR